MRRHSLSNLQLATVFKIGRDAGRPEGVVADLRGDTGAGGAAADHCVGVGLGQWRGGQHRPPPLNGAEQRPLRVAAQGAAVEISVQIGLMVGRAGWLRGSAR